MLRTNRDGAATDKEATPAAGIVGGSFKGFNRTGREETTVEILRPTIDSGTRAKYAALIAAVVVLLGAVGYMAFSRSRLSFAQPSEEPGKAFAQPAAQGE